MSAARKTRSRVLWYPALAAGAAVVVASLVAIAPISSATQATTAMRVPASGPVAVDGQASPEAHVLISSDSTVLTTDQNNVSATIEVTNTGENELKDLPVALYIDRDRISDEADLGDILDSDEFTASQLGTQVHTNILERVPAGETRTQTFTVPVSALGLNPSEPGVYALSVTVRGAGDPLIDRTSLVWGGVNEGVSTVVSVVLPVVLPASIESLATAEELSTLTGPDGSLTQIVDAASSSGGILAIDPRVIASIRVLGSAAPASSTDWLKRLATLKNPSFALQFSDADLAVQAQLALPAPLAVTSLNYANQASADESTTPLTVDELTKWNYSYGPTVWPVANSVSPTDTDFFKANGFSTMLIDGDNVSQLPAITTSTRATVGSVSSMVLNSAISEKTMDALDAKTDVEFSSARNRIAAELSLVGNAGIGTKQHLLVGLDRTTIGNSEHIVDTVNAIKSLPWVSVTSVTDGEAALAENGVAPSPLGSFEIADRSVPEARLNGVSQGIAGEADIGAFSAVLETPQLLVAAQRVRLMNLASAAHATPLTSFNTFATGYFERDAAILNSVSITQSTPINLLGSESKIPVYVNNALPFPVVVKVHTEASNNRLSISDPDENTRIEAASQSSVSVPVKTRVSNGDVSINVTLRAANDQPVGLPVNIPITIHADWEVIGIVVLGVLVVSFFGFGAWRSVRNKRKSRALNAGNHESEVD
ncbi:DUF6049 family protein [Lysinibacter cavernae]|uniref:Uncharacterized protein n=1 Tax=Lysinibacter cavernae TaxID=1640652 RepID=A0A7X5R3C5_9MICO|nr:DUF6049 family protein [Lysinibacter cavernae]NIH54632.1 hypothetical protein [Lysinibacter cavernae]